MAERLGRRFLALLSLGLCSIIYLLTGLTAKFGTSHSLASTYGTVASIFLFPGAYSFGVTPLMAIYVPEVLPYKMCTNGIEMQGILLNSCGVLATMAFPYIMEVIGWKTCVFNVSWKILMWLYIYFLSVETKGLTPEEIDVLFDGEMHVRQDLDLDGVKSGDVEAFHISE